MIQVELLSISDIKTYSNLAQRVIRGSSHYSTEAKKTEIKTFSVHALQERIRQKNNFQLVAKEGSRAIGFCVGYEFAGVVGLEWIGVDAHF